MRIIYSFNKHGAEAEYWTREIAAASTPEYEYFPFNHDPYINMRLYIRAQLLDNLYYQEHPGLKRLYGDIKKRINEIGAEVLLVDTCPPYHPEFLRRLNIYKVLRIADGPISAYDRDFAYLHAYDHILYHSRAYSKDMGMGEKLAYCGAKRADFWPLGSFEALCDSRKSEADILSNIRDIDVIFIGGLHLNKMTLLAAVRRSLGRRFRIHGLSSFKKNAYFCLKYGYSGWIRPVEIKDYVRLYQRSKIGINVHNRGDYTVGSYRLFDLPANGVMQLSDGGPFLGDFFSVGEEIVGYSDVDDLIEKVEYYLTHDEERKAIALKGLRRVRRDYTIREQLRKAGELIYQGMATKKVPQVLSF